MKDAFQLSRLGVFERYATETYITVKYPSPWTLTVIPKLHYPGGIALGNHSPIRHVGACAGRCVLVGGKGGRDILSTMSSQRSSNFETAGAETDEGMHPL